MGKFTPTPAQEKAFKEVAKAFKKAKKTGLVFYGKSSSLVAYKKNADDYVAELDFQESLGTGFAQIDCLSVLGCLADCGADDYPDYRTYEDQENFS